ncbi:TonB family protein [Pseudoalteromonas sp. DL2-H2.2]|uniref:TonB family protein n=1 Tax=Pseudoalteromonas sp. DL2-H2.2 TaxID=2908889 RepID=UPI001F16F236|nr:TonB family protein [Pseudoalteromonas sp. DL2-H2.2]MCF2909264.1 TonB family protein [Pseudoalteromonas sp. DL2-H2.2]
MYEVDSCIGEKFALIEVVNPKWPIHSERFLGFGNVDFRVTVNSEGKVVEHQITHSQPRRIFDRQSLRALKKWKFNSSKYEERCFDITFKFDSDKFE